MAAADRDSECPPLGAQEVSHWAIRILTFLVSSLKHKQMASDGTERKRLQLSHDELWGAQSNFISRRRFALQELVG